MTSVARDIVITWPKTKPIEAYLDDLAAAQERLDVINYRVAHLPVWDDALESGGFRSWAYGAEHPRCYIVHTGYVRGWTEVLGTCWRRAGEVEGWPSGFYIVRSPVWHRVCGPAMKSFRGWRWYER